MRLHAPLALLVLLPLVACGGDGATGPSYPDLTGSYGATYTTTFTHAPSGESFAVSCPGSISITGQDQGSFSGSYIVRESADCERESGTVSGQVRTDGGVNFTMTAPGADPNEFTAVTGCTFVSAGSQYNGTYSGDRLSASIGAVVDCFVEGSGTVRLELEIEVVGTKGG